MNKLQKILIFFSPIIVGIFFVYLSVYYKKLESQPKFAGDLEISLYGNHFSYLDGSVIFGNLALFSFILAIFLPVFIIWRRWKFSKTVIESIKIW